MRPTAALIVDGIFLHRPELRDCWDISIFLQVDFANSMARNAVRDGTPEALDPDTPYSRRYMAGSSAISGNAHRRSEPTL